MFETNKSIIVHVLRCDRGAKVLVKVSEGERVSRTGVLLGLGADVVHSILLPMPQIQRERERERE
jgi:hypothetical protein